MKARASGFMPAPDGYIARSPWWWSTTIDRWAKVRPGRGHSSNATKKMFQHEDEGEGALTAGQLDVTRGLVEGGCSTTSLVSPTLMTTSEGAASIDNTYPTAITPESQGDSQDHA
jgi:hypothetical protein